MKKYFIIVAGMMLLAGMVLAEEPTRWINVHVLDLGDNTKVDVRVPLSLVSVALDCVKTDQLSNGKLKLKFDDTDVDFKAIWQELRKHDNTDFVKVDSPEANVTVSRKGALMLVNVVEKAEKDAGTIEVKIPVTLMDALAKSEKDEIDLKAFVAELSKMTSGDLVTVKQKDAEVRIWIE